MPEPHPVVIYVEGADDRAFVEGMQKHGILPAGVSVKGRKGVGESTLLADAMAMASPFGGAGARVIALRDIDRMTVAEAGRWFDSEVRREATRLNERVQVSGESLGARSRKLNLELEGRNHFLVGIAVGRAEDETFRSSRGVASHAIDDFLIDLALDPRIYARMMRQYEQVPHDIALKKMSEVPALFRSNGLVVDQSKRLAHILRAITGFRAAPATFISEVFRAALEVLVSRDEMLRYLDPLTTDIALAVGSLRGS